ncbi:MAG: glycosyltransferase [Deltaproteobacteria bacterium]|nr:glycosyltransferase [Deltaproteobacteria bacterium]
MRIGHILIISYSAYPAPTKQSKMLGNIIKALGPRFDADVLTIRESDMGYIEKIKRNRLLRVPVGGTAEEQIESFQRAVSRQLDSDEYDIIHFRSPWAGGIIAQKLKYLESKILYEPSLGVTGNDNLHLRDKFEEFEHISLEISDMVVVSSQHQSDIIRSNYGISKPVKIIPPGVDVDRFDWDIVTGLRQMDIVWVDNFTDPDIITWVVDELSSLCKIMPDFIMGMVGNVDHNIAQDVVKIIEQKGLSENIKFFGPQEEDAIPLLISRGKLGFVSPSAATSRIVPRFDCINILEYMACKTPVIAPANPFVMEITRNGTLASLYNPQTSGSLRDTILSSLEKTEEMEKVSDEAYSMVRKYFTASEMRRRLVDSYAEILPPAAVEVTDEAFSKESQRPGTISWQGKKTSSTGAGSRVPTSLTSDHSPNDNEIPLEVDDIEFEASGVLLGVDYTDDSSETDPFQPARP